MLMLSLFSSFVFVLIELQRNVKKKRKKKRKVIAITTGTKPHYAQLLFPELR